MTKLAREGTTLLFVSHHLATVEALCTRGALLDQGRLVEEGSVKSVLARYLAMVEHEQLEMVGPDPSDGPLQLLTATCHGADGEERSHFDATETLEIRLRFLGTSGLERPHVVVGITDGRPGMLVECSMLEDGRAPDIVGPEWECSVIFNELMLRPRLYRIWCQVFSGDGAGQLTELMQVAAFRVVRERSDGPRAVVDSVSAGALAVPYTWKVTG